MDEDNSHIRSFEESLEISAQICRSKNYNRVFNQEFYLKSSQKSQLPATRRSLKINTNFTPRDTLGIRKSISPKYQELLKEMQDLEIQKKIRQKRKRDNSNSRYDENVDEVAVFINEKLREYHDIIDHKHLMPSQEQIENKKMKIEKLEKSSVDRILQLIEKQQGKLEQCQNLSEKQRINKQIVENYHKISGNLLRDRHVRSRPNRLLSKGVSSATRSDLSEQKSPHNINAGSVTPYFIQSSRNSPSGSFQKSPPAFNIKEPYISSVEINKNRQIQKFEKLNQDKLSVWKHRLSQVDPYFRSKMKNSSIESSTMANTALEALLQKSMADLAVQHKSEESLTQNEQLEEVSQQLIKFPEKDEGSAFRSSIDFEKNKRKVILSKYLSRHNPRYIKVKGTSNNKIIQRFDGMNRAKSMLQGDGRKAKSEEEKEQEEELKKFRQALRKKLQYKSMHSRKFSKPSDISADESAIVDLMLEEEGDVYYWTTCRNQQINLLLKGGKNRQEKKKQNDNK